MLSPRRRAFVRLVGLLVVSGLVAQPDAPVAAHMAITVQADRVLIGHDGEFVPRFATYLPNSLIVPPGRTVTLPPNAIYDAIEVAGTLIVSRDFDTTVRFTHLMILPGGRLDAGTERDPMMRRVTFIVRDVPIDTSRDPFQWGNGIVNFGAQTRVGRAKTTWTELTQDPVAGALSITVANADGWEMGDELLLPDTAQTSASGAPRRESPVVVTMISGNTVSLSKRLDFEHDSIRDPDGGLVLRPRVANLSRNIVIRSENPLAAPNGTRGHTANIGGGASWDIRYNQFVAMGRTRAERLDNTLPDLSKIGTNQIGKYAEHDHHAQGFGSRHIGNAYIGTFGSKWGLAIHQTHDVLVQENVCTDFQGGCFATEDGPEVRNIFRRNFAAYGLTNHASAHRNSANECRGCESAFWFGGISQIVEGNEAWNSGAGINFFHRDFLGVGTLIPSEPGGPLDTPFDPDQAMPLSVRANVTAANFIGYEVWGSVRFPADDHITAHNSSKQVYNAPGGRTYLRNPQVIGARYRSACVSSSSAYSRELEIDGGQVRGCKTGFDSGIAMERVRLANLTLQNQTNINVISRVEADYTFDSLRHLPAGSLPHRYIVLQEPKNVVIWEPGQSFPPGGRAQHDWLFQRGSPYAVINHQLSGQDYRLLYPQQNRSHAAWPAYPERPEAVPSEGLTMGQAWDTYGMAFRGDVYSDAEVVELDGIIGAVARPGLDVPIGPPRSVMTFPNMLSPAKVSGRYVRLYVTLTGGPIRGAADDVLAVSVDNAAPFREPARGLRSDQRTFKSPAISEGTHIVRAWRESPDGAKVPGSEMTFCYYVVAPSAPCRPSQPGPVPGG